VKSLWGNLLQMSAGLNWVQQAFSSVHQVTVRSLLSSVQIAPVLYKSF